MTLTANQFQSLNETDVAVHAGAASLERRGDSFVMTAPGDQTHTLATSATDLERLRAHWAGFSGRYPLPSRRAKGLTLSYDRDCNTFFVVSFGFRASLAAAANEGVLTPDGFSKQGDRELTAAQMDIVHEWASLEDNYLAALN